MSAPDVDRTALISNDGQYRYRLSRFWDYDLPTVGWIMLNPSTADAEQDDPTIRRCIGFAKSLGYGGISVRNLFALRATDPRMLQMHPDPVGPGNDAHLIEGLRTNELTVCAWGAGGKLYRRSRYVRALLVAQAHRYGEPMCLGKTKAGEPRHPLYLPAAAQLERL